MIVFSAAGGDASAEESDDRWKATKTQHPTITLRRKKLNGKAARLSNNTKTKSVVPHVCCQDITDTNVPDKQFLIQFDTLYKQMNGKLKKKHSTHSRRSGGALRMVNTM